jgi:hypothetical protein
MKLIEMIHTNDIERFSLLHKANLQIEDTDIIPTEKSDIEDFVRDIAKNSLYHSFGYSFWNANLENLNNGFVEVSWNSSDNCN